MAQRTKYFLYKHENLSSDLYIKAVVHSASTVLVGRGRTEGGRGLTGLGEIVS